VSEFTVVTARDLERFRELSDRMLLSVRGGVGEYVEPGVSVLHPLETV
jgi:hypothetical protein